jgi:hypothetical protein
MTFYAGTCLGFVAGCLVTMLSMAAFVRIINRRGKPDG